VARWLNGHGVAVWTEVEESLAIALLLYFRLKTSSSAARRRQLVLVASIYAGLDVLLAGDNRM
jgi:hypothetical protein